MEERLHELRRAIAREETISKRSVGSVHLVAISKHHSYAHIQEAYAAGVHDFGESYVQEAHRKIEALRAYPIMWHFVGHIQGNKTKYIAQHFSWVHSVSSISVVHKLNDHRPHSMSPLNICIQVNLDDEEHKAGVHPDKLRELTQHIVSCSHLKLRGLMCIPRAEPNEKRQYATFCQLKSLFDELNQSMDLTLDTLSMGMSQDFRAAIQAGSTIVRIGQGIFGARARTTT